MPEDWQTLDEYKLLQSWSTYLSEQAKIELSSDERVKVEGETNVEEAIETAHSTIEKSGLTAEDITTRAAIPSS